MTWGKIAIGLRCGQAATGLFVVNWTMLVEAAIRNGDHVLQPAIGLAHHYAAEALGRQFLATDCDSILYVDDDMIVPPRALEDMRKDAEGAEYSIMQGLCISSQPPHGPQVGDAQPPAGRVYEVPHCGLGFTLIRRIVFEEIIKKKKRGIMCFQWGPDGMAEDVFFCRRAKDLGFRCAMNSRVIIGHQIGLVGVWDARRQRPEFKSYGYCGSDRIQEVMF